MIIKEKWVSWEEFNLLFPGASPTSTVDFQRVGGLTPGSIPFANATGMLTEDNANLFWDETNARFGLGTALPQTIFHMVRTVASAAMRITANVRPWIQLECSDSNWGAALGLDADDRKFHIHYDSPIGTEVTCMFVFDGQNTRVGILEEAPTYPFDVGGNTNIQGTFRATGTATLLSTLTVATGIEITAGHLEISGAGKLVQFTGTPGGGNEGVQYYDSALATRFGLLFEATDVVVLCNRASNGIVEIRANAAAAGLGGETLAATFEDDQISLPVVGTLNLGATPLIRQASGALTFQTIEGTNTITYVDIKGKGTQYGSLRIYDQDEAERFRLYCYSGRGYLTTEGVAPGELYFQSAVATNIRFWGNIPAGNPYFYISGWDAGAVVRKYLRARVEADGDALIEAENDLNLRAGGGEINLGDENLTTTGRVGFGGGVLGDRRLGVTAGVQAAEGTGNAGVFYAPTRNVTADETNYLISLAGYANDAQIAGGVTDSGYRMGLLFTSLINNANFVGTLNKQYGIRIQNGIWTTGTGTIDTSYGLKVESFRKAATIGALYQIYLEADLSAGVPATAYGIYQEHAGLKNYFAGNVGVGQTAFGANATKTLALETGVAPTTSPADCFQMYSADIGGVAGKAGAHFRDEEGNVVSIGSGGVLMTGTARTINGDWIDAEAIKAPQTNPATKISHGILETPAYQFADAIEVNQNAVTFNMRIPDRMDRSVAPTISLGWSADGISPGDCEWQLEYLWTAPGEDTGAAAQGTVTVTGTAAATADGMVISTFTGIDLPSATDICIHCRVTRLSADVLDTIADTTELHGACLSWTSNKLGLAT